MIRRGDICWIDLGPPSDSRPAKRRPVLVVAGDAFNESRLATTIVAVITSNTALARMPGNVFVPARASGLARDSTVNVTGLVTVDKAELSEPAAVLPPDLLAEVDRGLRTVLGL